MDLEGNSLGLLSLANIRQLLSERVVQKFNYSMYPTVAMDPYEEGLIYVRREGCPEYTFNEDGAAEAVLVGNTLTMPDAQGFKCTFYLEPSTQG
ncbi:hypothetical protein F6X40_27760 [Paraburkholderia sp. UCT31]|uniref:hypothetical protein n=1 Tax=Paraburkholderia sp. UCT31 TaxID=2615209 RepID=UPI0016563E7D|nr:hypothetical protein [Paraburkholderia sp. UCT31]MBC8740436.1 hypothetical protein [Paraburkholderia sp. UCT31]